MDPLDVAILRTMGVDPYARPPQGPDALKPGTIARAIGVTPETVRERVQRMEAIGLIAGYQAVINLHHLGLQACSTLFTVADEERRTAAVKALEPVDGLLAVHAFLGPEVCVDFSFRTPADRARRLQLLTQLTGDAQPVSFLDLHMPPVTRPLTNLDWRILRALRGRAKRPLAEAAEEVGVGYRTVKRHYDRLCSEGSLYTVPLLNPSKDPGMIPFWLLFYLRPDAPRDAAAQAKKAYGGDSIMAMVPTDKALGNFGFLLAAASPAEIETMRSQGAALPGVARTRALVPTYARDCSDWVDDLIEARIRETAEDRDAVA